jgi:hypothetical protein
MSEKIINLEKLFKTITLRGQAAFLLSVGEMIVNELSADTHGISLARNAMDDCWEWAEELSVAGSKLYGYVDNEDEEKDLGVRELHYQQQDNQTMIAAVIALTCIVGYIARIAYIVEGKISFPVCIEMMDLDFINYILENACQTKIFDVDKAYIIMNYLTSNYLASNPEEELGSIISKEEIMLMIKNG